MPKEKTLIPDGTNGLADKRCLVLFFALAYMVSWVIWLPLVAASQNWISGRPPYLFYYLGTIGPSVSAIVLLRLVEGTEGVRSMLRKLVLWQAGIKWYLIALLLPAAVRFAALGVLYLSGYVGPEFHFRSWHELLGVALLMLVLVPFEEIGWRGFALPRLQSMFGAFRASIVLGVLWSLWHLPLVWVAGSYQQSDSPLEYMIVFTVTILPVSIIFTWLYNHTNGSLLLASLFHAAINITESALIIRDNEGLLLLLVCSLISAGLAVGLMSGYKNNFGRSR